VRAFNLATSPDPICCICSNFEDDPETGRMYGICKIALAKDLTGPRVVKEAYQLCDEGEE